MQQMLQQHAQQEQQLRQQMGLQAQQPQQAGYCQQPQTLPPPRRDWNTGWWWDYFDRALMDMMRTGGHRRREGVWDDGEISCGHVQHDREVSRVH